MPAGRFGKVLKGLEARHGRAETLRRWEIFVGQKGELGPEYFARTWSEWTARPTIALTRPAADGEAGRVFAAIRALVREIPNPGRAPIKSLPKSEVQELGQAALEAYEQVGGADRFLAVTGESVGFLLRDFTAAYRASSAHVRTA